MSTPDIPSVKVIDAIRPENAATGEPTLHYEDLAPAVAEYSRTTQQRSQVFWEQEADSLEEEAKARQLAFDYLLRTALRGVEADTPAQHDVWASRYTQASAELYGTPDPSVATGLLTEDRRWLASLGDNKAVDQSLVRSLGETYDSILAGSHQPEHPATAGQEIDPAALDEYGTAIKQRYQPIFDVVDSNKQHYGPDELRHIFSQAVDWLTVHDNDSWNDWNVEVVKGTNMSVSAVNQAIKIGERRSPADPQTVIKLLGHELLVHALRHNHGFLTDDRRLGTGLTNYMTAEEGLGKVYEQALTGDVPVSSDRYLDIALALGSIDGVERDRHQLLRIATARKVLRAQADKGSLDVDIAALTTSATSGVDRMYRGGRGDTFGTRSAIFTNDIVYYNGYRSMAGYITEQIRSGRSADDLLDYLSRGSFDPTDARHCERLEAATVAN